MHLVKKRGRNINFNCKVEFIFFNKKIVKKLTAFFGKIIFKEEQIPRTYGVLCVKLKGEFKMAKKVVLAGACRTAIGKMGGALSNTPAAELGSIVIKEALNRAGVKPEQVDEVLMGCVIQCCLDNTSHQYFIYLLRLYASSVQCLFDYD